MIDSLVVSNVLLWIVVIVLAVVVLALVRQIGVLHERVAPAGALMSSRGPRPGESAPVLDVVDWSGAALRVGGAHESGARTLLFFLSPTCPVCKTLLPVIDSVRAAEGDSLRVVLASDGPVAEHESFVREQNLDRHTYVLSSELGMAYRVAQLPYAVLVDGEGIIRSAGLVNSREHLESLFEAAERGVASVQEYLERKRGAQRVA
jgi:methylamine dehydrogenase accessory protein MauD